MTTQPLFNADAYAQTADAQLVAATEEGALILAESLFYPTGGGQPGDRGHVVLNGATVEIETTVKGEGGAILLLPRAGQERPKPGARGTQHLDWPHRYRVMRMHTALHLLSVVLPFPVSGGAIGAEKSRLDFNMPDAPEDKAALQDALNALIAADHPVTETWISDIELAANPGLVKTMAVKPPTGMGRVRLVRIGVGDPPVDLQPCGGTHVRRTGEIGPIALGKIEKKGRQNRRVSITFAS
ncbi:MAG: alanyl-tRNA editing protein [Pseudomonadota bacterium]